ncbi:hypothetical protein [Pseudoxanthomonas sp. SE1]|uniref:hypothetical protein n=1 Tax=Pseudoxanthomonas sp. SE1 TaxID=1664560 RepID=UPI00240DE51C|nr:hypothetical protein [Pseudoxanthomonas sp. SE1]WFC43177.1 hypothetical protein OY559_06620 [Pseudoxanthomonas sp. SE1]
MNQKPTPTDVGAAGETTTAAPAAAQAKKVDPAVQAIRQDRIKQANTETRFDATRFKRKEQK